MNAVRFEPLRESAQQTLVEAHLAEGNYVEALRAYDTYACLVRHELGIEPGPALTALVRTPPRASGHAQPRPAPTAGPWRFARTVTTL